MEKIKSIHRDHRKRVREKFLNVGLDGFAEHEILELLLFYAIPYKDTNPLAHRLIEKFGSLEGVFGADYDQLTEVDGVSDHTATLILLLPALLQTLSKRETKNIKQIKGATDAILFASALMQGVTTEQIYVICLDRKNQVRATKLVSSGTSVAAVVDTKSLTKFILQKNLDRVILVHNHPIGDAVPSAEDFMFTKHLIATLAPLEIEIVDHVIIAPNSAFSFAREGALQSIKAQVPGAIKAAGTAKSIHKVANGMTEY